MVLITRGLFSCMRLTGGQQGSELGQAVQDGREEPGSQQLLSLLSPDLLLLLLLLGCRFRREAKRAPGKH